MGDRTRLDGRARVEVAFGGGGGSFDLLFGVMIPRLDGVEGRIIKLLCNSSRIFNPRPLVSLFFASYWDCKAIPIPLS